MGDKRLEGRVALVTGGGGEIGGAIARRFAAEGAAVMVADIREEAAQRTVAAIVEAGGVARSVVADVGSAADCAHIVEATVAAFGKLTTLVNVAAAVTPDACIEALDLAAWNEALAVNLTASFLTAKHAVPHMRAAGGGSIVNIASQLGQTGAPNRAAYSTTKAALIQLTKCIATEYGQENIRANTISPGSISTARSARSYGSVENAQRIRGPAHLLGRQGRVDEIAAGAAFLASDDASFMTGADLLLDGGYLAFKGDLPIKLKK